MAPLTRNRAHTDGTPHEIAIEYYRQRASAGLIISEASQVSPMGKAYIDTPGIHDDRFIAPWQKITDAVHEAGGRIFLQLWHGGRISHTSLLPDGRKPLAPSAIRAKAKTFTRNGFEDTSEPIAMSVDQIKITVDEFIAGARHARQAGFDGVELHAANGYIIDQFIRSGTNHRDDAYGGSLQNRLRFAREIIAGVADEIGSERIGIRLSPTGTFGDITDDNPAETFGTLVKGLDSTSLAYLHMVEGFADDQTQQDQRILDHVRSQWTGTYIANGNYDAHSGAQAIESGHAHAIAYGRSYIANPDLPERFAAGAPLNQRDHDSFYGGNEKGYTDYPFMAPEFTTG